MPIARPAVSICWHGKKPVSAGPQAMSPLATTTGSAARAAPAPSHSDATTTAATLWRRESMARACLRRVEKLLGAFAQPVAQLAGQDGGAAARRLGEILGEFVAGVVARRGEHLTVDLDRDRLGDREHERVARPRVDRLPVVEHHLGVEDVALQACDAHGDNAPAG